MLKFEKEDEDYPESLSSMAPPPPVQRLVLGSKIQRNRLNLSALQHQESMFNAMNNQEPIHWEVPMTPLTPRTSLTQFGIRVRLPQHQQQPPANNLPLAASSSLFQQKPWAPVTPN